MCVRPVDNHLLAQCPLCLQEGQQLRSHLARHLRTIALFVLPKTIDVDREDVKSDAVQSGGSEEHEDANANIEAPSSSDQMSDISEEAMIDVPKIEHQAEQLMQIDPIEGSLATPLLSQLESHSQDSLQLKLGQLESAAPNLPLRPLPAFLLLSKIGMYLGNTKKSLTSSADEMLLQKLKKSSRNC